MLSQKSPDKSLKIKGKKAKEKAKTKGGYPVGI